MNVELFVNIQINGIFFKAGTLFGTDSDDSVFTYSADYIQNPISKPISISLPLQKEAFSPEVTRIFFEGLLPEGFTRKCVAQALHFSEDDYISILKELGKECLGAIKITSKNQAPSFFSYEKLSVQEVKALAAEGATVASDLVVKSHLSLTGASGKVGLYYIPQKKMWFKPIADAPSTHIVKQSHVRYKKIIQNEMLCLLTAKNLGLPVCENFIIKTESNKNDDENILFATKRYDRIIDETCEVLDDFKIPFRLHQEDFCQALGISSSKKYETNNSFYLKKMAKLIKSYSSNPIEDTKNLWAAVIFNFFIGNTDAHIKNFSLLYSKDLSSLRLAPFYDIISTCIYSESSKNFSFSINKKYQIETITKEDFKLESKNLNISETFAMNTFDTLYKNFPLALQNATEQLKIQGFTDISSIAEKIFIFYKKIKV